MPFTTNTRRFTLALSLLLTTASLADAPRPALSGITGGLRWLLYGPVPVAELESSEAQRLWIAAPPRSRVLGSRFDNDDQTAVMAFRSTAAPNEVARYFHRQVRTQGFEPVEVDSDENVVTIGYRRGNDRVALRLERAERDTYRLHLDLSGVKRDGTAIEPGLDTQVKDDLYGETERVGPPGGFARIAGDGIDYEFYGADEPRELYLRPETVILSVPSAAQSAQPFEQREGVVVARFQADLTLREVYEHYQRQLSWQGFDPAGTHVGENGNRLEAVFRFVGEDEHLLRITIEVLSRGGSTNTFRVVADLPESAQLGP